MKCSVFSYFHCSCYYLVQCPRIYGTNAGEKRFFGLVAFLLFQDLNLNTYFCWCCSVLLALALWSLDPFHVYVTFRFSILLNIYQFELRLIMALTISMTNGTDQKEAPCVRTACVPL